ncbi:MAG: C39 family peptidase [Oscillospiraceae bacterium]|nr:C39 family peptidase [Oscillospiraceae bacterium]
MKKRYFVYVLSALSVLGIVSYSAYEYLSEPQNEEYSLVTHNMNFDISENSAIEASDTLIQSYSISDFEQILQEPELPTGCEVTSLTMVLTHLGFDVSKVDIAQKYLPKQELDRNEDNELFGPDFRNTFAGNPEDDVSFGCLAPCIAQTADKYIKSQKSDYEAKDITGTAFYDLFEYISENKPVIIWSTQKLKKPEYITSWKIYETQETMTWPTNEHCVVLTGYDYTNNTVQINDPLEGKVTLEMEKVKQRYDQIGRNAVIISD